eukprot:maker-scaffold160_size295910-snap-gene-1.34 protein:Tk01242 transcript:maker-scaffold160_size295910-snap-gene-1.34-mRNA-1 annotation:"hypothetical protein L798_10568"
MWNKFPALREASTKRMASSVAKMSASRFCILTILILGCLSQSLVWGKRTTNSARNGKLFSLFQIVTFPNDPCIGNGGKNGTCFTNDECTGKGGRNGGTCAQGYGVCCTFTINCGGRRSENCTYFESRGGEVGGCIATICPCSTNICQLRLDFEQFTITGPSTSIISIGTFKFGEIATAAGAQYSTGSQCLTDSFSVGSPTGCAPPSICGINTGEHNLLRAQVPIAEIVDIVGVKKTMVYDTKKLLEAGDSLERSLGVEATT